MLKHSYFAVGQNLLTSRQPSARTQPVTSVTVSPRKVHHPSQQQQQQGGADDWQQTISVLQTPGHAHPSTKPLTKQLSKDLFPWLSEPDQNNAQPVLPQIAHKPSQIKVCLQCTVVVSVVVGIKVSEVHAMLFSTFLFKMCTVN